MRWRNDLIDQTFWHKETTLIKKIPLSDRKPPDRLIWLNLRMANTQSVVPIEWYLQRRKLINQVAR